MGVHDPSILGTCFCRLCRCSSIFLHLWSCRSCLYSAIHLCMSLLPSGSPCVRQLMDHRRSQRSLHLASRFKKTPWPHRSISIQPRELIAELTVVSRDGSEVSRSSGGWTLSTSFTSWGRSAQQLLASIVLAWDLRVLLAVLALLLLLVVILQLDRAIMWSLMRAYERILRQLLSGTGDKMLVEE